MTSKLLVQTIRAIHLVVLIFVITAPLFPWRGVWIAHAIFVPMMFLHWKTNRNRCVLTQIEARLKGQREVVQESGFIKSLWMSVSRSEPTEANLRLVINSILVVVWCATIARLALS